MSNSLQYLKLGFTPNNDPTYPRWHSDTFEKVVVSEGAETSDSHTMSNLYPESKYDISVIAASDMVGDITSSCQVQTSSITTRIDYPAFSNLSLGIKNDDKFDFSRSIPLDSTYSVKYVNPNTQEVTNVNESVDKGDQVEQLNGDLIDISTFTTTGISDFYDINLYDPEQVVNQDEAEGWDIVNKENTEIFENYYNENVIRHGAGAIIGVTPFNAKLGIDEITVSFNNSTPAVYHADDNNSDVLGTSEFLERTSDEDDTKEVSISDLSSSDPIGDIEYDPAFFESPTSLIPFNTDGDKSRVFAVLGQPGANSITADGTYTYNITAKSKTKRSSAAVSTLSIPMKVYFPPTMTMTGFEMSTGGQITTLNNISYDSNGDIKIMSNNMTEFGFANRSEIDPSDYETFGNVYQLNVSTHSNRPYLPLVNIGYSSSNPILDSGIYSIIPKQGDMSSDYFPDMDETDIKGVITANTRQIPFIFEQLCSSEQVDSEYHYTEYDPSGSYSPTTVNSLIGGQSNWAVIGAMPSYEDDNPTFYEGYSLGGELVLEKEKILNPSTYSVLNNNRLGFTWPSTVCQTAGEYGVPTSVSLADPNADKLIHFTGLIPGTWYFFRAVASNWTGTTVKKIGIRTSDPADRYFYSKLTKGNNVLVGENWTSNILRTTQGSTTVYDNITISTLDSSSLGIYGKETDANQSTSQGSLAGWTAYNGNNYSISAWVTNSQYENPTPISNLEPTTGNSYDFGISNSTQFASEGYYKIVIKSNDWKLENSNGPAYGNSHEYHIHVTASDTITVTTGNATNITYNSFTANGSYSKTGNPAITDTGFEYKLTEQGQETPLAIGSTNQSFNSNISSLTSGGLYYVRAYTDTSSADAYNSYSGNKSAISGGYRLYGAWVPVQLYNQLTPTINVNGVTRTTGTIQVS